MDCWICQVNVADSREHRLKRSDIESHVGSVSPDRPMFRHIPGSSPRRIASSRSEHFKFEATICHSCNTGKTQPYDLAWEKLSRFIGTRKIGLLASRRLFLKSVFPGSSKIDSERMQLFFIRILGRRCVEDLKDFDTAPFSECLATGNPLVGFHLNLGIISATSHDFRSALYSHLSLLKANIPGVYGAIGMRYQVGALRVDMLYAPGPDGDRTFPGFWSATRSSRVLRLDIHN